MTPKYDNTHDLWLSVIVIVLVCVFFLTMTGCGRSFHNGVNGLPGGSPSIVQQPSTITECPAGGTDVIITSPSHLPVVTSICNGLAGAVGPTGSTGSTGATGNTGAPGQDLTPITFVQFCPGVVSYPSEFPEYGIVVDGNVYGVYSANDGFLALLPPGVYNSNAIGNSCTFTINPDGTISN